MIKTIIFDLGNVIVNFDETNIFNAWAAASSKTVTEVIKYFNNSSARKSFERGEISPRQFYDNTLKELGMKMGFNAFKKVWNEIFTLNRDVEKIIKSLKGKYRLVLLSNTNVWQYEYIKENYKIVDIFDAYVLSYEAGCRKPNPMIYINALKKAKTMPFNCAYFDDIREFVNVAKMMGIKSFQFRDYGKLISDLKKVKVTAKVL